MNRKIFKKALKIAGILLAVFALAAGGLLLWLRSSSGAAYVADRLTGLLAEQGITLTAADFSGPLPSRFSAQKVAVSDAGGPFFTAAEVEAEVALFPLLRGQLHIPLIAVASPELIRLPDMPPAAPEEPGGEFSLPLDIRLDELRLTGGRLRENALAALNLDTPALGLSLAASGQWLDNRPALDFETTLTGGQGQKILAARLSFQAGAGEADALDIDLTVDDQPGGLLSRLMRDPEWGGLQASLRGQGPLTDWPGRLEVSLGGLGQVLADLHFAGPSGQAWRDLFENPDWQAALTGEVLAGVDIPPEIADRLSGKLRLNLTGAAKDSDIKLDVQAVGVPGLAPGEPIPVFSYNLANRAQEPKFDGAILDGQASLRLAESLDQSEIKANVSLATEGAILDPRLAGLLVFGLQGEGRLDGTIVKARADFSSPELTAPQGVFANLGLDVWLDGHYSPESPSDLVGRLELRASDSPGGPLNLAAEGRFRRDQAEARAELTKLDGHLAGLDLNGSLTAIFGKTLPSLSGELKVAVEGWEKLAAVTGQPLFGSPARLDVALEAPEGRQAVKAELSLPSLKIGTGNDQLLDLNQLGLTFQADDLFGGQNLDVALKLGPGRSGPLAWKAGSLTAEAQGGLGTFTAALDRAQLAESKAAAQDGLRLDGRFDLPAAAADLDRLDFRLAGGGLKLAEPLRLTWAESPRLSPVTIDFLPSGRLAADIDLSPGALKIKADLQKLPYGFLKSFGLAPPEGILDSFTANLAQGHAGLAGDFHLQTQAAVHGIKPSLKLNGQLTAGPAPALAVDGALDGGPNWKSGGQLTARLPLRQGEGLFPAPDRAAPLSGRLEFTGDLGPLWALMRQPDRSLSGRAQIQAELGGSLARPQPQGSLYLAGGRYADRVLGLLVNEIALEAHAAPEAPLRAVLSAKDQHGGGLALEAQIADLAQPSLTAQGRVSRFNPLHRDDLKVFLSGDLAAEGPLDRLTLSSNLTVDRGELDLKLVMASGGPATLDFGEPAEKANGRPGGLRFDLKVKLPNQFFIRGYGLDSEWQGDLAIGGSARRPSLTGFLAPVRGYFEIFSKQFQFAGGDIAFNGGTNPSLNLELTNSGPDIEAILRVGGHAKQPKLTFDSRPSRPQEEVLSQVLFGKSASSISRFETLQLARAVRELATFGEEETGFNPMGFMRESLGLDVLRMGGGDDDLERRTSNLSGGLGRDLSGSSPSSDPEAEDSAIAVEAGKYLSDNVYVGVEHGADGAAIRMEVELRPNLSLEGRSSAESSRVGLGWKKDY